MLSVALRTVLACGRIKGRVGRALHAALSGLWMGLLSDRQLRALDQLFYDRDPTYASVTWNEHGLQPWEDQAVRGNLVTGARVVVPACGGGREVLSLLSDGFDALGYEPHPGLSAYAQRFLAEHGHPDRAFRCAPDRFPESGPCDGVLVGWTGYSLIAPRERRVSFLRGAATATAPGGPVILSAFVSASQGRALRLPAQLANALRRLRGWTPVEAGDTLAPNRVHVFTREQLERELRDAGLVLASYVEIAQDGQPVGQACAIARVP